MSKGAGRGELDVGVIRSARRTFYCGNYSYTGQCILSSWFRAS
jgi:hypothetical protein